MFHLFRDGGSLCAESLCDCFLLLVVFEWCCRLLVVFVQTITELQSLLSDSRSAVITVVIVCVSAFKNNSIFCYLFLM